MRIEVTASIRTNNGAMTLVEFSRSEIVARLGADDGPQLLAELVEVGARLMDLIREAQDAVHDQTAILTGGVRRHITEEEDRRGE